MPANLDITSSGTLPALDPRVEVQPSMKESFRALGLTTPEAFLDIPGEIVSGHPDRHVMRVVLANGQAAYLKREHCIRLKDRYRNWRANFGWVSKSLREGRLLQHLERAGLPGPKWLAFGEDRLGRAFLLIEEIAGASDLRRYSPPNPDELAVRLGRLCAEFHEAGFDHPDLFAKHLLIDPATDALTLIDWPRALIRFDIPWKNRIRALAALHATFSDDRVSGRQRFRFLWAYLRVVAASLRDARSGRGATGLQFGQLARSIDAESKNLLCWRGIREQRHPPLAGNAQRLVWLDGEALCAIPDIADQLTPEVRSGFYDPRNNNSLLSLRDGTQARLEVGIHGSQLKRCWSRIRRRDWRSPEMLKARLLFHLERHRIPAPKLLAYGQRHHWRTTASFLLHEAIPDNALAFAAAMREADEDTRHLFLKQLANVVARLHDAGCEVRALDSFTVTEESGLLTIVVSVPGCLRLHRHLSERQRKTDCERLLVPMMSYCGAAELRGYFDAPTGPR